MREAPVYNVVFVGFQIAEKWYRGLFGTSYWTLKDNYKEGVEVFDAYHQQNFKLRAILLRQLMISSI